MVGSKQLNFKGSFLVVMVCFSIIDTVDCTTYFTNSTRTPYVSDKCSNTNRDTLYAKYGTRATISYYQNFKDFYTIDLNLFSAAINVSNNNASRSQIFSYYTKDTKGFVFFIIPFLVGLLVVILIWPFLLCCMCCRCACCNDKQNQQPQYTNCEMTWPIVIACLLSIAIIAACVVGMASNYKYKNGYSQISCSGTLTMDDILNGNVSYNGNGFFVGLTTALTDLINLKDNIDSITTNMTLVSSAGTAMPNAKAQLQTSLTSVSTIPSLTTSALSLSYGTPLDQSVTTATISSTFPALLGTSSQINTLVGAHYNNIQIAATTVQAEMTAVDNFTALVPAFKAEIPIIISKVQDVVTQLQDAALSLDNILNKPPRSGAGNYVEIIYYIVQLGLILLLILALVLTLGCKFYCCRYFVYLQCALLFVMTILGFIIGFALSVASPMAFSGCQYISNALSNPSAFTSSSSQVDFGNNQFSKFANVLIGQSGQLISEVGGLTTPNYTVALNYAMLNITNFNGGALATPILNTAPPLTTQIATYAQAGILDIGDGSSINILKQLSTPSSGACINPDSWIPSISQTDNAVPCGVTNGALSDNSTCTSPVNFQSRAAGCVGCMDTFSLFFNNLTSADVLASLTARYSGCSSFNSRLSNVWQNFYKVKVDNLGPVKSRQSSARSVVSSATATLSNNLPPLFASVISKLYATSQAALDPQYGMIAGLNGTTIGEDLQLTYETVCENVFSYTYFHRIIFIVISFGLSLLLCCVTCIRYRFDKTAFSQSQRDPYKPQSEKALQFQMYATPPENKTSAKFNPYYQN